MIIVLSISTANKYNILLPPPKIHATKIYHYYKILIKTNLSFSCQLITYTKNN